MVKVCTNSHKSSGIKKHIYFHVKKKNRHLQKKKIKKLSSKTFSLAKKKKDKKDKDLSEEEIKKYYEKISCNYFDAYGYDSLELLLKKEKEYVEGRVIINEEILFKYGLSESQRRRAADFIYNIVVQSHIDIKVYFKTISIFDSFLIKYYEHNKNIDESLCLNFFKSKIVDCLSENKLYIFMLICLSLANQINNTKDFRLKTIANNKNNEEYTYEEIVDLSYEILTYIDCDVNTINIYDFIDLYLFDITKRFKVLSDNVAFIEKIRKSILFFSAKIIQYLNFLKFYPSNIAFTIIAVAYDYTKLITKESEQDLDNFINEWWRNMKSVLLNYEISQIKSITQWLGKCINAP